MSVSHISEKNIVFAMIKVVGKFFLFFSYSITVSIKNIKHVFSRNKIVFYVISKNNYSSVQPVYEKLPVNTRVIFADRVFDKNVPLFLPVIVAALFSFIFFPQVLYHYFNCSKEERERFKKGVSDILISYPFYYTSYLWFKVMNPKGIVISNDHVYSTRVLVFWAKKFNIPSFYIQHASVTENFPVLEMEYAFLEGEDAKIKYVLAGSNPDKIQLVGIPKLDCAYSKINYNKRIKTIGVASNGLESSGGVIDMIFFLVTQFPDIKIVYRPHMSQYYDKQSKIELNSVFNRMPKDVFISNPLKEPVIDYLAQLDCMIAGDSSIHLEAVMLNINCIYFSQSSQYFDYYGYVKNGLIEYAKNYEELRKIIINLKNDRQFVRYKSKKYCSTVETEFDGKSADLVASLLMNKVLTKIK